MYHNDIKPGNICFTTENGELNIFLIDLDSIDFDKRTGCTLTPAFSPGYADKKHGFKLFYKGCDHTLDLY